MDGRIEIAARGDLAANVLERLIGMGYARCEPPILQPASVFLDQSGEDIRGRLYFTSDASGADLCLRPEYTIPVFRQYLASGEAGRPKAISYLGPVFRQQRDEPGEFIQAGLESFGRADKEKADAEVLSVGLDALEAAVGRACDIRIGDAGLFTSFLAALDLPAPWRRRIKRGHSRGQKIDDILAQPTNGGGSDHAGVLAALANANRGEARALVEDLLSIAGIASVGGRSAGEIAERFLEQASMREAASVGDEQRLALKRFFDISGDPDTASLALRDLASEAAVDLDDPLDCFDSRLNYIAGRGVDLSRIVYSARFSRRLDYYTGFVFEAVDSDRADRPLMGGGRYDTLSRALGAESEIPAVGAAIWCERLAEPHVGAHP